MKLDNALDPYKMLGELLKKVMTMPVVEESNVKIVNFVNQHDTVATMPISKGKIGQTFLTVHKKRVQLVRKSAMGVRVLILATKQEIELEGDYPVIPIDPEDKTKKLDPVESAIAKKEEKSGFKVEPIESEDESEDEDEDEEEELAEDEDEEEEDNDDEDEAEQDDDDDEAEELEEQDDEEDSDDEAEEEDDDEMMDDLLEKEEEDDDDGSEQELNDDELPDGPTDEEDEAEEEDDNDEEEEELEENDEAELEEEFEKKNEKRGKNVPKKNSDKKLLECVEEDDEEKPKMKKSKMLSAKEKDRKPGKKDKAVDVVVEKRKRGRPPKTKDTESASKSEKLFLQLQKENKALAKRNQELEQHLHTLMKKISAQKKEAVESKPKKKDLPKYDGKKQINLVISLLQRAPQSRESLAKAIKKAGLGKNKEKTDAEIKNYVSVMLTKIKEKYVVKSPRRGVYFIKGKRKLDFEVEE